MFSFSCELRNYIQSGREFARSLALKITNIFPSYTEVMPRKTVYNEQLAAKIIDFISLGYTLKDTADEVGLSDETIRRWRVKFPSFNEAMVRASNEQWNHSKTFLKRQCRGNRVYRRQKVALMSPSIKVESQKPVIEPLRPSKRQYVCGLPVRPCQQTEMVETSKYYNSSTDMVEWIDRYPWTGRLTFHRCPREKYEEQLREKAIKDSLWF